MRGPVRTWGALGYPGKPWGALGVPGKPWYALGSTVAPWGASRRFFWKAFRFQMASRRSISNGNSSNLSEKRIISPTAWGFREPRQRRPRIKSHPPPPLLPQVSRISTPLSPIKKNNFRRIFLLAAWPLVPGAKSPVIAQEPVVIAQQTSSLRYSAFHKSYRWCWNIDA